MAGVGLKPASAVAAPGARSGMSWPSGSSGPGSDGLAAHRNRLHDTITTWTTFTAWEAIVAINSNWKNLKKRQERLSIGMAMLPKPVAATVTPGVWQMAALGAFDYYYDAFARNLATSGRSDLIIRVGWEHNHTFPWFSGPDPENYKLTFHKIVGFIRLYNPGVLIDWCGTKGGKQTNSIVNHYPGNDVVDIISRDFYDVWPALNTQEIWDANYMRYKKNGSPLGLGAWLKFALDNGKPFGCPEWGIRVGQTDGTSVDNPFYIRKMFEFFTVNQANIAYENYFNQKTESILTPSTVNPLASAEYKRHWGRPLV
jgi:hypothetical protein